MYSARNIATVTRAAVASSTRTSRTNRADPALCERSIRRLLERSAAAEQIADNYLRFVRVYDEAEQGARV